MKYRIIILLLTITILFTGCNNKELDSNSTVPEIDNVNKTITEYINEIEEIEKNNKPIVLVKYIEEHSKDMDAEELSLALYSLRGIQLKYIDEYNKSIKPLKYQREISFLGDKLEDKNIKSLSDVDKYFQGIEDELKDAIYEAYSGNYKLVKSGSRYIFIIDYDKYFNYGDMISEILSLIQIYDKEQEILLTSKLNYNNLGDSLFKIEEHLLKYKDGLDYDEVLRIYSKNLLVFLEGNDRNSLVDSKENELKSEYKDIYIKHSTGNKITSKVIREYLKVLEESQYKITDEVKNSIMGFHNKAIAMLEG